MRSAKKKRLESKGWKVGTAAEFLGLTPAEELYVNMRVNLADGLRRIRSRSALTQAEVASAVGSSQSRVAKMEAGDPTVSIDLLIRSLLELGASPKDLAKMIAAAAR